MWHTSFAVYPRVALSICATAIAVAVMELANLAGWLPLPTWVFAIIGAGMLLPLTLLLVLIHQKSFSDKSFSDAT